MSKAATNPEPSLREQLLADYDELEDQIEDASTRGVWSLADWLAQYVPERTAGRPSNNGNSEPEFAISLNDLAERRGRSKRWLQALRKVAHQTAADRLEDVSPRVYMQALKTAGDDLAKANKSLREKGTRLRDHAPPMESMKAIREQLSKRTAQARAELAGDLLDDEETRKEASKNKKTNKNIGKTIMERKPIQRGPRPQDQGWLPKAILARSVVHGYSAWAKMQDSQPPDEEMRAHCIMLAEKGERYMVAIQKGLKGGKVDEELRDLLSEEERRMADNTDDDTGNINDDTTEG